MVLGLFSRFRLPWRLHKESPGQLISQQPSRRHLNCSLAAASCPKGKQVWQGLLDTRPLKVGKLKTQRLSINGPYLMSQDPRVRSGGEQEWVPLRRRFSRSTNQVTLLFTLHPSLLPSFCRRKGTFPENESEGKKTSQQCNTLC